MKTTLSREELVVLAVRGHDAAHDAGTYIDPVKFDKMMNLLRERGESWIESVLMHKLANRSPLYPHYPRFTPAEMETLILADQAELDRAAPDPGGRE